jgi:hypothetical protein
VNFEDLKGWRLELRNGAKGRIGFGASAGGSLIAYDAEGQSLGNANYQSPRAGWVEFEPVRGARKYVYAK